MTAYQFSLKLSHITIYMLPILALAGNSLILLVVLSNLDLNRSSFAVYVKSMAISDTLVLLFKLFSYQNKTSNYFYFPSLCTILIVCSEASVFLSVWTIVAITIERTLVVLFPLHTKNFISAYRARRIIITIAIFAILFSARILIIPIDRSIIQKKRCHPISSWHSYRKINMTITEFGYCYIPVTIVIIGNLITICSVKRAVIRRHDLLQTTVSLRKDSTKSYENQLMLMLLIVTLMFIVYFVPFTITNIISRWGLPFNICFTQRTFETYLIIRTLCELLKDFNFCTNFIIYCISGRRFRNAFLLIYKCDRPPLNLTSRSFQNNTNRNYYLLQNNTEQKASSLCTKDTIEQTQF